MCVSFWFVISSVKNRGNIFAYVLNTYAIQYFKTWMVFQTIMKHRLCTSTSGVCINTFPIQYPLWSKRNQFKYHYHSYTCWTAARVLVIWKSSNINVVFEIISVITQSQYLIVELNT